MLSLHSQIILFKPLHIPPAFEAIFLSWLKHIFTIQYNFQANEEDKMLQWGGKMLPQSSWKKKQTAQSYDDNYQCNFCPFCEPIILNC